MFAVQVLEQAHASGCHVPPTVALQRGDCTVTVLTSDLLLCTNERFQPSALATCRVIRLPGDATDGTGDECSAQDTGCLDILARLFRSEQIPDGTVTGPILFCVLRALNFLAAESILTSALRIIYCWILK